MSADVHNWIEQVVGPQWYWYVKILSGNDTLLNSAHGYGPYIPRDTTFALFPSIGVSRDLNPRTTIDVSIDSHGITGASATVIWYNNRLHGGSRNEARITGWGGRRSPLLDPESTGSLCVFAFLKFGEGNAQSCRIWLCRDTADEEIIQARIGPVDPGVPLFIDPRRSDFQYLLNLQVDRPCALKPEQLPAEWFGTFPSAEAVVRRAIDSVTSAQGRTPDQRLMLRRGCEFELFRSIEQAVVLPKIRRGFDTVDMFVEFAHTVTNRRKARSGASLELQAKAVFDEERLGYSHAEKTEDNKRPDFLFPHVQSYRDNSFPSDRLRMLGAKTTVKDRWRQILDEADRIPIKHLLTLQRGISVSQFTQMRHAGVVLVVPRELHNSYVPEVRAHLLDLSAFISQTRALVGG